MRFAAAEPRRKSDAEIIAFATRSTQKTAFSMNDASSPPMISETRKKPQAPTTETSA